MSDTSQALADLGKQIESGFLDRIKGATLTTEEAELVARVSDRLALASSEYLTATSPEAKAVVKEGVDLDLATLANIAVAKEIQVQDAMAETVNDVIVGAVSVGMKALLSLA